MSELHVLPLKRARRGEVDLLQADLQAMLDRTLAQIEAIERDFEHSRVVIVESAYPQSWKDWRLAHLELRRQRDRAPLVQLAAHVHQRLRSAQLLSSSVAKSDRAGERPPESLH